MALEGEIYGPEKSEGIGAGSWERLTIPIMSTIPGFMWR
jgi:hypothetical protein